MEQLFAVLEIQLMGSVVIIVPIPQVVGCSQVTMHVQGARIHTALALREIMTTAGGGCAPLAMIVTLPRMSSTAATSVGMAIVSTITMTLFCQLCT